MHMPLDSFRSLTFTRFTPHSPHLEGYEYPLSMLSTLLWTLSIVLDPTLVFDLRVKGDNMESPDQALNFLASGRH
jgi:hypothetical protein